MSTDKTLADVQPGGRVRLGDQAERARFEAWASKHGLSSRTLREAYEEAQQFALSAQPSPGGQGDALEALAMEMDEFRTTWGTIGMREFGYFVDTLKAALAARQPVASNQVVQDIEQLAVDSGRQSSGNSGELAVDGARQPVAVPLASPGNGEWSDGWNSCREATLRGDVSPPDDARHPVGDRATKQSAPAELWGRKLTRSERQCWAQGFNASLGSRQTVRGPVGDDTASEAFSEFADDYLTDGNGYASASTYEACNRAFKAAWPDRDVAVRSAREELKRLHGDDRTVGARRAEVLNRETTRDDEGNADPPAQAAQPVGEPVAWLVHWSDMPMESPEVTRSASRIAEVSALTNPPRIVPLYAAPPAQAVDLEQLVPDPKAVPDDFAEDDSDAQYNSGWNDCRDAVLALIDGKAVGK